MQTSFLNNPVRAMAQGSFLRFSAVTVIAASLAGCTYLPMFNKKEGPSYQDAKVMAPLEVPPDLIIQSPPLGYQVPGTESLGRISVSNEKGEVYPESRRGKRGESVAKPVADTIALVQSAEGSYLQVDQSPDKVWAALQRTLPAMGFAVANADKDAGVIDTDWRDVPTGFSAMISALSSTLRERYHLTLDNGEIRAQQTAQEDMDGEWVTIESRKDWHDRFMEQLHTNISLVLVETEVPDLNAKLMRDGKGYYLLTDAAPQETRMALESYLTARGFTVTRGRSANETAIYVEFAEEKSIFESGYDSVVGGIKGLFGGKGPQDVIQQRFILKYFKASENQGTVVESEALEGAGVEESAELLRQIASDFQGGEQS